MTAPRLVTSDEPTTWYQHRDQRLFLADVVDPTVSDTMSVGFARYDAGAANTWTMQYDEALIVTKGAFSVRTAEGEVTARPGEVIFLTAGTELEYRGEADGTEVVYVSYPHWMEATQRSETADLLGEFHPVESATLDR
jgi:ethanolamine utilization protein EutQ